MSSLVLELQRDSADDKVPVSTLLRKGLMVARKLDVSDIEIWLNNELNGYNTFSELPEYRKLTGQLKILTVLGSYRDVMVPTEEMAAATSQAPIYQGIPELEILIEKGKGSSEFIIPFDYKRQRAFMQIANVDMPLSVHVSPVRVHGIIEAVRNAVLDLSLRLEKDGILGEGLTFSLKEKQMAANTHYNTNNFFGSVNNAQIQQETDHSSQSLAIHQEELKSIDEFTRQVRQLLPAIGLDETERAEIEGDIATVEAQIRSPKPKAFVIKESLKTIGRILEKAAGSAVAAQLIPLMSQLHDILTKSLGG